MAGIIGVAHAGERMVDELVVGDDQPGRIGAWCQQADRGSRRVHAGGQDKLP